LQEALSEYLEWLVASHASAVGGGDATRMPLAPTARPPPPPASRIIVGDAPLVVSAGAGEDLDLLLTQVGMAAVLLDRARCLLGWLARGHSRVL
jgi:hypothetical protein